MTAISFWVTRAETMAAEMNGFGLLDSEGDSTPRFEEASRVGQALNRHADLFGQPSWPGAEVAILVDEYGYQFSSSMQEGSEHLPYSVRGWHRLLWDAGIPVDFVEASELDDPRVGRYKALILPFPLSLAEEVAQKLAHYVGNGGHLISEACPGRINEHAYANRGELSPTMRALFGVRQESLTLVREPAGRRWSPCDRIWGQYLPATMLEGTGPLHGLKARANLYVETFAPVDSDPCLLCGQAVAGTVRRAGRGQAWLLGTLLGHTGTAYRDGETRAFVRALLEQCGVAPAHHGKLLLRKRAIEGKEAWLFTNPTGEELTESVSVGGWAEVDDLLGEPLAREGDRVVLTVPGLDVRTLILRR